VWVASGTEPATWQVSGTDGTAALQAAGAVGVSAYLSSNATNAPVTARYSSFVAQPTTAQANQAPTAAFTSSCTQLSCTFSGGGSSDSDGTVTGWAWNFGDNSTGTGSSVQHGFAVAGTYSVTLTVTDNQGAASAPVSHSVTVTAPPQNQPPSAAFTFSCSTLACSFNGTGSTDDKGVVTWTWDFGDGSTGTGSTVSHTFGGADTYHVQLTVNDADDATDAVTHDVTVTGTPPANQKPTAVFTSSCTQLSCTFSGGGSSDPDGSVTGWAWTFGDGTTGSGSSVSHTYGSANTYQVTLTVTDNQGLAGDPVTHPVTVTAPAGTAFVSDSFARTVSNGWGSAPVGGAWSASGSAFSVAPGTASTRLTAGAQLGGYVPGVTRTDADVLVAVGSDKVPVGGQVYLMVQGRRVSAGNEYDAKVLVNANGSVTVRVTRLVGNVETALAGPVTVPGVVYAVGTVLDIRLQVTGTSPTTVRARVWASSGAEPSTWQVSGTDSTAALQAAGAVGVSAYLSSNATNAPVTIRYNSFTAKPTAAP
jgi:PKD repeat protein